MRQQFYLVFHLIINSFNFSFISLLIHYFYDFLRLNEGLFYYFYLCSRSLRKFFISILFIWNSLSFIMFFILIKLYECLMTNLSICLFRCLFLFSCEAMETLLFIFVIFLFSLIFSASLCPFFWKWDPFDLIIFVNLHYASRYKF